MDQRRELPGSGGKWLLRGLKRVRTRVYMEETFRHKYN
jgi:hypothetical protein